MIEPATKRVLLTGGSGQLGRRLRETANPAIDLFAPPSRQLDLRDRRQVRDILREFKPDLIINAAAYTQVDKAESEADEAFAINARGVEFLAREADPAARIIQLSTDFVFDGAKRAPYVPADATHPLNVYGRSKLAGEEVLRTLKPDNSLVIRTSWLYSAEGSNFAKTMLRLMRERDALSVVDDQRGTPTSTASLAAVVWRFAQRPALSGVFHWSDQGEASWYEFALAIQEQAFELGLLERRIPLRPIPTADYPTPARRPAYSVLDKRATREALDFEGSDWRDELKNVLKLLETPK